jgi:hypothetical protein
MTMSLVLHDQMVLLYQPLMTDENGGLVERYLAWESQIPETNLPQYHSAHHNSHMEYPRAKLGSEKQATNYLSYGVNYLCISTMP